MELLQVKELSIQATLLGGQSHILHSLSFEAQAGKRLAIVGESGCGKSMTALAILGLLPKNCTASGQLLLQGENLLTMPARQRNALRGREIVLIPQSGADFLNPVLTVGSQMAETLRRLGIHGKKNIKTHCHELLQAVGFAEPAELLGKYPFQLSGGMAQRVVMAMGMAGNPLLVVADEPTRGVDDETAATFMNSIVDSFPQAAVIIITHNIAVAKACERLLVMRQGNRLEYGDTAQILKNPGHPYTQSLIDALPENGLKLPEVTP